MIEHIVNILLAQFNQRFVAQQQSAAIGTIQKISRLLVGGPFCVWNLSHPKIRIEGKSRSFPMQGETVPLSPKKLRQPAFRRDVRNR